ncbi:glycosyltransferase, partial [Candidatus Babeliales bacterium]|nr:glycosyltransferase [Candidatus Babeliales bacterium]
FWPEAAHPDIHKPYDLQFEYDVSFVGGKYGWRPKFIARLQKMGVNITCFGNGWENGPLSDEEMVKLYSRSRINLGFAGVGHSKKLMCLKGRDFEVPMSGGLYLTQDNPELSLVYNVGKEILTYRNEKDCVQKIKWLLDHPDEAANIREAGRIRVLKDHTWEKRFLDIFKITGLLGDD